jgi:uncharacterized membrane protein YeaQ/YmgE (transglycosylase-associated protein family)
MDGLGWVGTIIVGGLAGWIASIILKIRTGLILNIVLGILGAVALNALLSYAFQLHYGDFWGNLVVGIIGAGIIMVIFRAVTGRNV